MCKLRKTRQGLIRRQRHSGSDRPQLDEPPKIFRESAFSPHVFVGFRRLDVIRPEALVGGPLGPISK